jgi:GNAT superfamily N-acetyltransferase
MHRVNGMSITVTDSPPDGMFQAIFRNLRTSSMALAGPVDHRLLAIPLLDSAGAIAGGLWGCTAATWLMVEMLFVPDTARGRGTGGTLMRAAEREAVARGCGNAMVDTINPDAARFFERLGFVRFGTLEDFPPGHQRMFYQKRLS